MIIDSSALVAVLADEPERPQVLAALSGAGRLAISAATFVECAAVVDRRRDPVLSRELDQLLQLFEVE